jgi:hypothetical protein
MGGFIQADQQLALPSTKEILMQGDEIGGHSAR